MIRIDGQEGKGGSVLEGKASAGIRRVNGVRRGIRKALRFAEGRSGWSTP